jgi:hypothetical protein
LRNRKATPYRAGRGFALVVGFAVAATTLAARPARAAIPLDLTPAELDCQNATFVGSTTYVQQAFAARHDCFLDYMKTAPQGVDCSARLENGGTGDALTDQRLANAAATLSETLTNNCAGVSFGNLGYPGFCPIDVGGDYTSADHEVCILTASDDVVDVLFAIEHPIPIDPPLALDESGCGDTIGRKSSRMFVNEVEARENCQMKQLELQLPLEVNCRAEQDRFDPATGDTQTDTDILTAHNKVLREIANACGAVDLDVLAFPGECTSAANVEFVVADVVECMYATHHDEMIRYMDVLSPSTSQCGNGQPDFTEDCDDGNTTWVIGEYCRGNCSAISQCGDVNDDGRVTATDALFVLQSAIGLQQCAVEICDANGDGEVTATDASMVLAAAVGLPVDFVCPAPVSFTCGNAIIDENEECDDGDSLWLTGELCSGRCLELLCGDPDDSGNLTSSDARYMLLVALGLATCDLEVCDVDANGAVSSTDVLKVLAFSTGQAVTFNCPGR